MKLYVLLACAAAVCLPLRVLADPPAAPSGLVAAPQWANNCAKCHMPMPHVTLSWTPVAGAASYTVSRDGAVIQSGLTAPKFVDMDVQSGHTYSYTVAAAGADGTASQSSDAAPAVAPLPPTVDVPVNVCIKGVWQGGASDQLTWTPVAGAAAYNVYQYDKLIGDHVKTPAFTVVPGVWAMGLTYTITALDTSGNESLPSAPVTAQETFDPNTTPSWEPSAPVAPWHLAAKTEWNRGAARVRLTWHGDMNDWTYRVYRDGAIVADGLWGLTFLDTNVAAGEQHTYTVSGLNVLNGAATESAASSGLPVTVDEKRPVLPASLPAVQILKVVPQDDSVLVFYHTVPGAVDYRVYDISQPGKVKYAGVRTRQTRLTVNGQLAPLPAMARAIQWNGIDPAKGADLVVEAVDKLGAFQTMDGAMGPGAMNMDGMENVSINGQGDPANVPNVLARSAVFHVTPQAETLSGEQAFFDTFRTEQPLVQNAHPDPAIVAANPGDGNFGEYQNDKWTIRNYQGDLQTSRIFFMGNHFMDTLYDGGTPGGNVIHNNNASLVMMPNATADISGGRVLHVTFEVDAHFDGRRWCDVFIGAAGDPLVLTGKFAENNQLPTVTGNLFRWEIRQETHNAQMFLGGHETDVMGLPDWASQQTVRRLYWDNVSPLANGTQQDLDKRHRFDLYLSQTHFRIMETTPDGLYSVVRDNDLPAGQNLPFTKAQVYFVHQLYHTGNDRNELVDYEPWETYWHNLRPWCDERHWDNMGFEVLPAFPAMPDFAPLPK